MTFRDTNQVVESDSYQYLRVDACGNWLERKVTRTSSLEKSEDLIEKERLNIINLAYEMLTVFA